MNAINRNSKEMNFKWYGNQCSEWGSTLGFMGMRIYFSLAIVLCINHEWTPQYVWLKINFCYVISNIYDFRYVLQMVLTSISLLIAKLRNFHNKFYECSRSNKFSSQRNLHKFTTSFTQYRNMQNANYEVPLCFNFNSVVPHLNTLPLQENIFNYIICTKENKKNIYTTSRYKLASINYLFRSYNNLKRIIK